MAAHEHPRGHYRFAPGIEPYSGGVRAADGHEVVHVTLRRSRPWREGFDLIDRELERQALDRTALAAIELRCPEPHSFDGFGEFNNDYRALLDEWDLLLDDGTNPIARTNVAPVVAPPSTTHLHGFSYIAPNAGTEGPSFVIAGAGDLVDQAQLHPDAIVHPGDYTAEAWSERIGQVMTEMESRMAHLDVDWGDVTVTDVYCAHNWFDRARTDIIDRIGPAAARGLHWYDSHPPILGLSFEMDLRGVATERFR